jgi:hypothetical protein
MAVGASPVDLHATPKAGDILTYGKTLGGSTADGLRDGAVWAAKRNLDAGMFVAAHVLSGMNKGNVGPLGLEHWLLLLAYQDEPWGCIFGFWDSDSNVSVRETFGTGFGILQYCKSALSPTMGGADGLGANYPNGRLTTESHSNGLLCDPEGNHTYNDGTNWVREGQHRYQVGEMVPYVSP